jgi:hypothetical protein
MQLIYSFLNVVLKSLKESTLKVVKCVKYVITRLSYPTLIDAFVLMLLGLHVNHVHPRLKDVDWFEKSHLASTLQKMTKSP